MKMMSVCLVDMAITTGLGNDNAVAVAVAGVGVVVAADCNYFDKYRNCGQSYCWMVRLVLEHPTPHLHEY